LSEQNAVVTAYAGAEKAMKELQRAGIEMRILSIASKDSYTEEHAVGYYNTGDRMKYRRKLGAFVAGPLVVWIAGAAEGAAVVGGVSAMGAGLYGTGIPRDSVVQYELAIKTDKFLAMAHGAEVETARGILESTRPVSVTRGSPGNGGSRRATALPGNLERRLRKDVSRKPGAIVPGFPRISRFAGRSRNM
jgi:hypothetical protein